MHRVIRSIRKILPDELPTIRDLASGKMRPMNEQELLNADIVCINPTENLYACSDQDRADDELHPETGERVWSREGVASPGTVINETLGAPKSHRYNGLPAAVKAHVLHAHVKRKGKKKGEVESHFIPMSNVKPTDEVISDNHLPHHWAGER